MTTTTKRARTASAVAVSPQDFVNVRTFLTDHVLIERTVEARMMELAAVSGTNIHLLGPPGTAKSLGLREYSKCMTGSAYFEKAMNAGMPADAIIGAYDMAKFAKTGEFTRNVDGHLPTADVGFVDEMFRANGPAQDALLPMANSEERQFEFNGGMHRSSLLLFASASNQMPDADNEQAQALVDRITLVLHVDRLKSKDSFKELIRRHHARTIANLEGRWEQERVTITVEQVREAQRLCKYVDNTRDDFLDALATLRDEVYREGLGVSDRRWVELVRVMQAVAWMNERDYCTPEDCAIAEFGIATAEEHAAVAHKLVLPFLGRFETEAVEKAQEAAGPLAKWAEIRPAIEEAGVHVPDDLLRRALLMSREIDDVKRRVDAVIGEAENEKRDAASLRAVAGELLAAQKWVHANKLPTDYKP
jgi:MoxR-like ATPase